MLDASVAIRSRKPWAALALVFVLGLWGCGATAEDEAGTITAALAPPGSDAALISASMKPLWYPGERDLVSVTLRNSGAIAWTAANPAFALRSLDRDWGWRYSALSSPVAASSSRTFTFAVGAPNTGGSFDFAARMSALGLGDFGDLVTIPTTVSSGATPHWGCSYVPAASGLPTRLAPDESRVFVISTVNSGSGTWTPGFFLASEDSPPSFWGQTNLAVDAPVPPGATKSWTVAIRAPSVPGTYSFRREMRDTLGGVGDFRRSDFCVDTTIQVAGSKPLDSTLVAQNFRSPMAPGEPATVTVSLENSGTDTWQAGGDYVLSSLNTPTSLWGETLAAVPSTTPPGATAHIDLHLVAPTTPGNYAQKWRLRKLSGSAAGFYGATVDVPVTVSTTVTPQYGAAIVQQDFPKLMTAGKLTSRQIIAKNTGLQPWTGPSFGLQSLNSPKGLWTATQAPLRPGETVATGATHTFSFDVRAPSTPGTYVSAWRMSQSGGVGGFGQTARTTDIVVTLCGNSTLDAGEQCDDGNLIDGDGCSARCRNESACAALPHVPVASYALQLTSKAQVCSVATLSCADDPVHSGAGPATLRLVANGTDGNLVFIDGYLDAPGVDLDGNGSHSEMYGAMLVDSGNGWGSAWDPTTGASDIKLWGDDCIGDYWIGKTVITVHLTSGEVTSFQRGCETHYLTFWYSIWVNGTGSLICE